jgi:hypothetical protein
MAASDDSDKPKGLEFYGGYPVYSESGLDLTLLRQNLARTVEQRWTDAARGAALFTGFRRTRTAQNRGGPTGSTAQGIFNPQGLVQRLHEGGVEFVVIGGLAMIAHGSTYLTKDLEVCYNRPRRTSRPSARP